VQHNKTESRPVASTHGNRSFSFEPDGTNSPAVTTLHVLEVALLTNLA